MIFYDERSALLWDVALGDAQWSDALEAITASTGDSTAYLLQAAPGSSVFFRSRDPDGQIFDETMMKPEDLLDPGKNPITRQMVIARPGNVYDRRALVPDRVVERHPSMLRFRQQDIFHGLIANLHQSSTEMAGFWVGLPRSRGDDCALISDAFASWIAPLQRTFKTLSLIQSAENGGEIYSPLGSLGPGVALVDANLVLKDYNEEAARIFRLADGITSKSGVLTFNSLTARRGVQSRIRSLWEPPKSSADPTICVARPSGLPSYSVDVMPSRSTGAAAKLVISDPVGPHKLRDVERVRQRFGLTEAEARVVRLAPLGLSKSQIARLLGVSENTVKTHISASRAKMGAKNMVQLAVFVQRA